MVRAAHPAASHVEAVGLSTVGIDVGGKRKGFHAVAMTDGAYAQHCVTTSVEELVNWCCNTVQAQVIGIDAPCRWSMDDRARPAERELMSNRIWCFSTPTRQRALDHPKNHYGWMLQGEALFNELEKTHVLCTGVPVPSAPFCFETFPHAITWHWTEGKCSAKNKKRERSSLLKDASVDISALRSIDLIDAALCALAAYCVAVGRPLVRYGHPDTGLIWVPQQLEPWVE